MAEERIVTFEAYYDPMEAQIIRSKLSAYGVKCFVADEYFIWARPYLNQATGGVKIKVFERDIERCREILTITDVERKPRYFTTDDASYNDFTCPYCSSANTLSGIATEVKFHLPSVLLSLFFFVPLYFRPAVHCFNCHREFQATD